MTNYRRRLLSILLAASMVFTMNAFAFAEEVTEDDYATLADVEEIPAAYLDEADAVLTSGTNTSPTQTDDVISISGDKVLSENLAAIEVNLNSKEVTTVGDYLVVYPLAVAFGGKDKPGSKKFTVDFKDAVKVYKRTVTTVSASDLVSWNAAKGEDEIIKSESFNELTVKKVGIKAAKGATVDLTGKALFEAKKSTFIKSIKLDNKDDNKAFQTAMKEVFKKGSKSVEKVSANGLADGKEPTTALFTIAVYPCYVGNDDTARKEANDAGLLVGEVNDSKSKFDKAKVVITNADGKKANLKLTKDDSKGKYKGLNKAGKQTCDANDNSLKATSYYIADGNYAGNIYFK